MREAILAWASNPDAGFALLAGGALGLLWEWTAPGKVLPAVAGLTLLSLGAHASPWFAVAALGAAVALGGVDAKFGGRGMLSATGALGLSFAAIRMGTSVVPAVAISLGLAIAVRLCFGLALRATANKWER